LIPLISALIKKEKDSRLWGPKAAKHKVGGTTPAKQSRGVKLLASKRKTRGKQN